MVDSEESEVDFDTILQGNTDPYIRKFLIF